MYLKDIQNSLLQLRLKKVGPYSNLLDAGKKSHDRSKRRKRERENVLACSPACGL